MPIYTFQHPKSGKVVEVIQRMSEPHVYVDAKNVTWIRIFSNPQVAFNTILSATDSKTFVEKTRGKNYSLGQMWDLSAELSAKREGASGVDEIRVKAESTYKNRTQQDHPHSKKKSRKRFEF